MPQNPYVAVEGVIGVGKTTLARLLQKNLGGVTVLEEFEENPFLSNFYADRARYAFQTQIFFLLSRYRQQTARVPAALREGSVVADYTFAKDRLFAGLLLHGDEMSVYQRVYEALSEKVRRPDLLVYLKANHDVLMARISARDRSYERNMDPDYIEQLRIAYEDFITTYTESPVLAIDTNELNIVDNPDDITHVVERVKSALEIGMYQAHLPGVGMPAATRATNEILEDLESGPQRLSDFQQFHISLDAEKQFDTDLFLNFVLLSEEIGELARVLKKTWEAQSGLEQSQNTEAARQAAVQQHRAEFRDELADCFAYLLKISNYVGIDLQDAYIEKMAINAQRKWNASDTSRGEE